MRPTFQLPCVLAALLPALRCQSGDPVSRLPAAEPQGELKAGASVTVFPALLAGAANADVANVLGILLERGGSTQVEIEPKAFVPEKGQDFAAQAAAFGAFVGKAGLKTDYALFASISGVPGKGIDGVRGALVDKQGKVVWSDEQQKGSKAFDAARPGEPLDCVVLLVQQLRKPLRLEDPMRANAPASKLEQRMKAQTGVPPETELKAMDERLAALRLAGAPAILVYPVRVGSEWSADGAAAIVAAIEKAGCAKARAVAEAIPFTAQASSNEQRTLWSAARSIQEAVRKAKLEQPDYLLFADFLMAGEKRAGAVHTFLLTPAGDLVFVDYQNSHHGDFQKVAPASVADCARLAAIRLAARLAE